MCVQIIQGKHVGLDFVKSETCCFSNGLFLFCVVMRHLHGGGRVGPKGRLPSLRGIARPC